MLPPANLPFINLFLLLSSLFKLKVEFFEASFRELVLSRYVLRSSYPLRFYAQIALKTLEQWGERL